MAHRSLVRLAIGSLLGGASLFGLTTAAQASHVLFSTDAALSGQDIEIGHDVTIGSGTTQITLDNGAIASFVDAAQFSVQPDGSINLRKGTVTIVSPTGTVVDVHMPDGVKGSVEGVNASASFSVGVNGTHGSVLGGRALIAASGVARAFTIGTFWSAQAGHGPAQVIAADPAHVPSATLVMPMRQGGVAAAAQNGIPTALGVSLAAIGAHGDILDAARRVDAYDRNPSLAAFPRSDYNALIAYAAQASSPYGGAAFNGAGADIVRTYFQYLARGGVAADFRTGYATILLSYLDLLRAGALPSSFTRATQPQLTAYLAFIGRTERFGTLSAANRNLLDAYLTFLSGGGAPDGFSGRATSLGTAYLDYIRSGGSPASFAQASQSVVSQYLLILQSGAIRNQLSVTNQALLDAYLASVSKSGDGLAFSTTAATSLAAFTVYLNGGGLPSGYRVVDAATLRSYLETLDATGLFDRVLGTQSAFLRTYLVYLRTGASADTFDRLPINVLTAQAASLNAFAVYLNGGGRPSGYTALTADQITSYLAALQSSGRFALTGANAQLFTDYYAFLIGGGQRDAFAKLPINVLTGQATALNAYYSYIQGGGTPSLYGGLTQTQIIAYLTELRNSGLFGSLLGVNASFLSDYYAYLATGGNPDIYAGLPNVDLNAYATRVNAFVAYLRAGNLPSTYGALTVDQVRAYLNALSSSGQLTVLLGSDATFLSSYLTYLQGGGAADQFTGLPINIYRGYSAQLTAYFAYLNGGGLPSNYTLLTAAQIRTYLETLQTNGQFVSLLGANSAFFTQYLVYLTGGGSADTFTGLPIASYTSYTSQLTAFVAYLNGGGLPSAYTALTQAQIRSYLEALQASGQYATLLGANASFFTSYLAYLTNGGTADTFTGLPIVTYRNYATALNAYYVYLLGGGRPSGYTVLTQAQIKSYLDALAAAGQATVLLGDNASFFSGYLTYLVGGGAADQYASLPATGGGTVGTIAATPPPIYRGGFPATGGHVLAAVDNGKDFTDVLRISVNTTTGVLGSVVEPINYFGIGTATAVDVAGDASAIIGRYTNGTTYGNNGGYVVGATGIPYVVLAPKIGALPTAGTISYSTLAATQPVASLSSGTPGTFLGQLSISFGAMPTYTLDGSLTMPEASGSKMYTFASARNASLSIFTNSVSFVAGLSGNGTACASTSCRINFFGNFAGANPANRVGLIYLTTDPATYNSVPIRGAVIFGANGTFTPATVTPPVPSTSLLSGPVNALWFNNNGDTYSYAGALAAVGGNGVIDSLTQSAAPVPSITRSNASAVDYGYAKSAAGSVVAWNRWASGTPVETNLQLRPLSATQSTYITIGTAPTNKPASGIVRYNLLSNIAPTVRNGSAAPGTFNGSMYVNFGTNLIGYDFLVNIGGVAYTLRTGPNPTNPTDSTSYFDSNGLIPRTLLTITGGISNGASVTGRFFGNGFTQAGIDYQFGALAFGPDLVNGSAIFGSGPQTVTSPQVTPAPFVSTYVPPATSALPAPTGTDIGFRVRAVGKLFSAGTTTRYAEGTFTDDLAPIVANADGQLQSSRLGSSMITRGTAANVDYGTVGGVIGWSRWAGGTVQYGSVATDVPTNGGFSHIWGSPATAIPATGTALYTMVGGTKPTDPSGVLAPGSVIDAKFAVSFANSQAGFDAQIAIGGSTYAIGSQGGSANPTMSVSGSGTFSSNNGGLIYGFLAGPGASHAGVSYYINGATPFTGVIAFAKGP